MNPIVPVVFCSTLLFGACHSGPPLGQRVDAALLRYVGEGDRAQVAAVRVEADEARDRVAATERQLAEAKGRLRVAERQLVVTKAVHDRVKAEIAVAGEPAAESAALRDSRDVVRAAEADVRVREAEIRVAEHRVRLARERQQLAQANVDLVAAEAVAAVDRPECRGIDVPGFERKVWAEEPDVQVAEVRLEEAERELTARREPGAADHRPERSSPSGG
jgi:hypothetical protein